MLERITVTVPAEMAADVERAVEEGDYVSASEVVHEALQEWRAKRARGMEALCTLKADIQKGLDDMAAGRLREFDAESIIERGRKRSAAIRSSSG